MKKKLYKAHQRALKALSISYNINHWLLDTGDIAGDKWEYLCSLLNDVQSLREKNSIVHDVSIYLDDYIGAIRFVTKSSKLIIGDKACYGERTVIVSGHKVYDLIEGLKFGSILEYVHFLNAYNVSIGIDPQWSRYIPVNRMKKEFNVLQWEALTSGDDVSFDKLFELNDLWEKEVDKDG